MLNRKIIAITAALFAVSLTACDVEKTKEGNVSLPKYEVEKTKQSSVDLPKYDVKTPEVTVRKEEKTIEVPTVKKEERTVQVPNVDITPAKDK